MEQLDLVYNTFANLERNYARSKKSRSEYIADKFGGNIQIGSFLILNALSAEEFTDPEDIRKFSFVRDIFGEINAHADSLDALESFDFKESTVVSQLKNALNAGQWTGMHIETCTQSELYGDSRGVIHYDIRSAEAHVAPLMTARYYKIFSNAMVAFATPFCKVPVKQGDILERKNLGNELFPASKLEL